MSSILQALSKHKKILQRMEQQGYPLKQLNGQRTYGGPPPNWGHRPPPSRDSEVFIGKIPRMCFEDELIPLFVSAGELYEFRLLLDFSGTNRGYGYAHYATHEDAMKAIELFDNYEIRPGHYLGVMKSKNNCRLLLGNLYGCVTCSDFDNFLRSTTEKVVSVTTYFTIDELKSANFSVSHHLEDDFMKRVPQNDDICKFAVVEYESHKAAALARRVLIPQFGHLFAIDWAIPLDEIPQENECQVSVSQGPPGNGGNNRSVTLNNLRCGRPVPILPIPPPRLHNLPPDYGYILKYFSLILQMNLQKCVHRMEVPLHVYFEIQEKILGRITSLEHCGPAVQLTLNYLSWYNDKRKCCVNPEIKNVLMEVKLYSDSIVYFLLSRTMGTPVNSDLDHFHCHVLPVQLIQLYRLGLLLLPDEKDKIYGSIGSSLQFLDEIHQKAKAGDERMRRLVLWISRDADGNHVHTPSSTSDLENDEDASVSYSLSPDRDSFQGTTVSTGPSSEYGEDDKPLDSEEELYQTEGENIDLLVNVPILPVRPSITDRPWYMPSAFENVVKYLKYIIRKNLEKAADRGQIPLNVMQSIEVKIVNRIKNVESCRKAVGLIMIHLSKEYNCILQGDLGKILQDVAVYTTEFFRYITRKCSTGTSINEDHYYCFFLPYRISFLYRLSLLLGKHEKGRLTGRITDSLVWLNELIHRTKCKDIDIKEFFDEVTKIALENNESGIVPSLLKDAWDDYYGICHMETCKS
ncbi:UNVERIFIED_CONTAM: hypothetical protein PYX00_000378 [Menopon gallinae]|uniref:RRM domain-containing protein n=1 Tax=Menopon gallinae TaxID=328185 RepID=A0AAW2I9Y0_9NEOP